MNAMSAYKAAHANTAIKSPALTSPVGQHQMWEAQYFPHTKQRSLVTSGGLGTMGFGLPAAMGAKAAHPDALVIDIDGDLWAITYFQHVKPGKGGAFVRTKLKNVLSGKVVEKTFNAVEETGVKTVGGGGEVPRWISGTGGLGSTVTMNSWVFGSPSPLLTRSAIL